MPSANAVEFLSSYPFGDRIREIIARYPLKIQSQLGTIDIGFHSKLSYGTLPGEKPRLVLMVWVHYKLPGPLDSAYHADNFWFDSSIDSDEEAFVQRVEKEFDEMFSYRKQWVERFIEFMTKERGMQITVRGDPIPKSLSRVLYELLPDLQIYRQFDAYLYRPEYLFSCETPAHLIAVSYFASCEMDILFPSTLAWYSKYWLDKDAVPAYIKSSGLYLANAHVYYCDVSPEDFARSIDPLSIHL